MMEKGSQVVIEALMQEYGLTRKAAEHSFNTESVQRIITIFGKNMGILQEVVLEQLVRREREATEKLEQARTIERENEKQRKEMARREVMNERRGREAQALLEEANKFREELRQVETPEARDKLRLLEIFKDNSDIRTPQNNTMFIAGCAAILSGTPVTVGKKKEDD